MLSGRAAAEFGDERLEVGPGDFLGYPPGMLPHALLAIGPEDLVLLTGGESHDVEVADFLGAGKRIVKTGAATALHPLES